MHLDCYTNKVYICSIKFFKQISLYLAGFILVLHSLMPHQHHSEISSTQDQTIHEHVDNVIDFMQLFLHTDMGDGHLEHFDNSTDVGFDLQAIPLLIPSTPFVLQEVQLYSEDIKSSKKSAFADRIWIPKDQYLSTSTLRGPPVIS